MSTEPTTPSYSLGLKELRTNLKNMLPSDALKVFDTDAKELQAAHTNILKLDIGDKAPDFTLYNAVNKQVSLSSLLQLGKVVLVFYRGNWCPYCNLQLTQYQKILKEIKNKGANLVALSPQTPDASLSLTQKNELQFEVLSDIGNLVAKQYTTVFKNGEEPLRAMNDLGIDFDSFYGDDSKEIPVPAVFIVESNGTVSFVASLGGDYRNRVEPKTILNAL